MTCDNRQIFLLFSLDIYIWNIANIDYNEITKKISNQGGKLKFANPIIFISILDVLIKGGRIEVAKQLEEKTATARTYGHNKIIANIKSDEETIYGNALR
jgi:hypothetical protein